MEEKGQEGQQKQSGNGMADSAKPITLLVCTVCGTELHPVMARVLSFKTISKQIGRRVLAADLAMYAFCKRHESKVQDEGEETFEYAHAFATLKEHARQNEADEQEREAIRTRLLRGRVRVTDEKEGGKPKEKHRQKEGKPYDYLPASERERGDNS